LPLPPGAAPDSAALAVKAWNLLGGLEWPGIEAVAEMLGITDIETLVWQLVAIRNWQRPETTGE